MDIGRKQVQQCIAESIPGVTRACSTIHPERDTSFNWFLTVLYTTRLLQQSAVSTLSFAKRNQCVSSWRWLSLGLLPGRQQFCVTTISKCNTVSRTGIHPCWYVFSFVVRARHPFTRHAVSPRSCAVVAACVEGARRPNAAGWARTTISRCWARVWISIEHDLLAWFIVFGLLLLHDCFMIEHAVVTEWRREAGIVNCWIDLLMRCLGCRWGLAHPFAWEGKNSVESLKGSRLAW